MRRYRIETRQRATIRRTYEIVAASDTDAINRFAEEGDVVDMETDSGAGVERFVAIVARSEELKDETP